MVTIFKLCQLARARGHAIEISGTGTRRVWTFRVLDGAKAEVESVTAPTVSTCLNALRVFYGIEELAVEVPELEKGNTLFGICNRVRQAGQAIEISGGSPTEWTIRVTKADRTAMVAYASVNDHTIAGALALLASYFDSLPSQLEPAT